MGTNISFFLRLSIGFSASILVASLLAAGSASAQTVGPDEAMMSPGGVKQTLALTPAQRSAIYDAVIRERTRTSAPEVGATVGATVPAAAALRDLPEQAAVEDPETGLLKYAIVEDEIVVVDPIRMRVVDVIHRGTEP
jgi:hypothetical protein